MLYAFETPFEEPEQPEITEADVKEADAAIYVISRIPEREKTAGQRREILSQRQRTSEYPFYDRTL